MSKAWMTRSKSSPGSRPASRAAAVTSNSLPKSQTPTRLPAKSAGVATALSAHETESVPERWKVWAMFTRSEIALGHGPRGRAAPTRRRTPGPVGSEPSTCGATSRAAVDDRHVEALLLPEAQVLGGEVARELRLRDPLEHAR